MLENLYIVRSPLQFLNAIEARENLQCENNTLLLIYNSNEKNSNQINTLLIEEHWSKVIKYNPSASTSFKHLFLQVSLVKNLQKEKYNYIFSGDFGTINQILLANLVSKRIYLIDDGNATIFIYEKLKDSNYFLKLPFSKKLKFYRYSLFGLEYKIKNNINFFTIFNIKSTNNINVIHHQFEYLKLNRLNYCNRIDTTYILGQNFVEIGAMKENIYLNYLQNIATRYSGKIVYIPHRSEKITTRYEKLISNYFKIEESSGAIEIVFLNKNIYPKAIVSFISSALFNLDKIFSEASIDAIKIDPNDLLSHQEVIDSCYDFFSNTGVQIKEL